MPTREPWLGDALRALSALQPDADADADANIDIDTARAVLRMLSMPMLHGSARLDIPPGQRPADSRDGGTRGDDTPHEPAVDRTDTPAASPEEAAPGHSHRLPSVLEARSAAGTATPPAWLSSSPALTLDPATLPQQPAAPLLPRQRRRAILNAVLHTQVAEGRPDLRQIVRWLGSGRPLARVPRLPSRTLRHGVDLRIDRAAWLRPFHDDQLQLRDALVGLLGAERVHTVLLDGGPHPPAPRRRGRSRAQPPATTPTAPTPVLVLGDLGVGYRSGGAPPAPASAWRSLFDGLRRQGRRSVVLTPLPGADGLHVAGLAVLPWSERTTLGDALRARHGQSLPPPAALGEAQVQALARELSPAVVIGPALLRLARHELGLPPAAEAELAASDMVQSHGAGGLVFDADVVRTLRAELADSPALEAALQRIERLRGPRLDGNAIEERLIALELRGQLGEHSAEAALQPALKALSLGGEAAAGVAQWAVHAWTRMSDPVRATEAARALAYAASAHVRQADWLQAPGGADPALPGTQPWLFGAAHATRGISVELRRYDDGSTNLLFGPAQPARCAVHLMQLPAGPLGWLQVDHGGHRQVVQLGRDGSAQIHLQSGATAVAAHPPEAAKSAAPVPIELTSLHGERWVLRPIDSLFEAVAASRLTWGPRDDAAVMVTPVLAVARLSRRATAGLSVGEAVTWRTEATESTRPERGARIVGSWADEPVQWLAIELNAPAPERVPIDAELGLPSEGTDPADRLVVLAGQEAGREIDLQARADGYEALAPDAAEAIALAIRVAPGGPLELVHRFRFETSRRSAPPREAMAGLKKSATNPRAKRQTETGSETGSQMVNETVMHIDTRPVAWLAEQASELAWRQWRCLIVATEGHENTAHRLWDDLLARMPAWRVAFDHDGRVFGSPDTLAEFSGPHAVVVLVGTGALRGAELAAVERCAAAGRPLLWAPAIGERAAAGTSLAPLPASVPAAWPEAVARALHQRVWIKSDDGEALAREVADWSPPGTGTDTGRAESIDPAATEAAPPPAAQALATPEQAPMSLRARLVRLIERREDSELGLFTLDPVADQLTLRPSAPALRSRSPQAPLLLFMHGITGDVKANFSPLLQDDLTQRDRLRAAYGEIYAWQYRSITRGPLANAVALARALPAGTRLHLVSYSGGGVIGELLCRSMRSGPAFDDADRARLESQGALEPDALARLDELNHLLASKALVIERFVRISAPIDGSAVFEGGVRTTVRLARAIPWIGGVLSSLPGIEGLLTDPAVVPGPASMVPGAGVQSLLTTRVSVDAPLTVITGVRVAESLTARAGAWLARTLASRDDGEGDHWVSLASALGGMERTRGVDYRIERGEDIDHAAYMGLPTLRAAVVDALLAEQQPAPGFTHAHTLGELQRRHGATQSAA